MSTPTALVQKLWNYCNILRDDGLSYGDYVEQLTFLLFLKMADEQAKPPFNPPSPDGLRRGKQAVHRAQGPRLAEPAGPQSRTAFVSPAVITLERLSENHER